MPIKQNASIIICCLLFLCPFITPASAKTAVAFDEQWSRTLDYSLYIAMPTSIGDILAVSYTAGEVYTLVMTNAIKSTTGRTVTNCQTKTFKIK